VSKGNVGWTAEFARVRTVSRLAERWTQACLRSRRVPAGAPFRTSHVDSGANSVCCSVWWQK